MATAQRVGVRVTSGALPYHDPLTMYEGLRDRCGAQEVFLFESPDGPDRDRRSSVVGVGPLAEIRVFADRVEIDGQPDVASALVLAAGEAGLVREDAGGLRLRADDREALWRLPALAQRAFAVEVDTDLVPGSAYAFGFLVSFAYESAWHMESLPGRTKEPNGPDITLTLFRDTVWYDLGTSTARHLTAESPVFGERPVGVAEVAELAAQAAAVSGLPVAVPPAPVPLSVHDSVSRETFLGWAERCLEHIGVGDIYQIQIGHRVDVRSELKPLDLYRRLRHRNPSPYMYLMPRAGRTLIGASPELFLRIEGDEIEMRPIAGTTRRGPDDAENELRVKEMQESTKERAEHVMLVDLCRNDLGRVCRPSDRPVDRLMSVERYSHVFHLVSSVTGRLEEGVDVWDAVRATFPAGTMTGAPKVRAMEIIDGLERQRRGSYAGAVGLVDVHGWSELALCIRSVEYDGTSYSTQSSAGLVALSDPAAEWRETLAKMGAAYWALTGEELQ